MFPIPILCFGIDYFRTVKLNHFPFLIVLLPILMERLEKYPWMKVSWFPDFLQIYYYLDEHLMNSITLWLFSFFQYAFLLNSGFIYITQIYYIRCDNVWDSVFKNGPRQSSKKFSCSILEYIETYVCWVTVGN